MGDGALFGVPEDPFGRRDDLASDAFGVIPVAPESADAFTKTGQAHQAAISEASSLWIPSATALTARLRIGPKPATAGIAGAATNFTLEMDMFRSTAPENTDGSDGTIDYRSGYIRILWAPLSTEFIVRTRGQAVFGDAQADAEQYAELDIYSGESGSLRGSGTDWGFFFNASNSITPTVYQAYMHSISSSSALIQFDGPGRMQDLMNGGAGSMTGNATPSRTDVITWARAYTAGFSVAAVGVIQNSNLYCYSASSPTTTGWTIGARHADNSNWSTTVTYFWISTTRDV